MKLLKSSRTPILKPPRASKEYKIKILNDQCDGCKLCVEFCPTEVLTIDLESFNSRMLNYVIVKDIDACTGCKMCERICPSVSIYITEKDLPKEDSK
jgi:2-oxoglutarate ferredoxin oxidoreductase subunit delta